MRNAFPIFTVLCAILAIWYAGSVWMNSTWVFDQATRNGQTVTWGQVIPLTMAQDRPLLPPPHQVVENLWKGIAGQAVTSKRSLVYHGFVTFRGTMAGFALGIVFGVGMAMAIVRFRVMDQSVMPWAIISQTIPIVALAPMILTVSNQIGIETKEVPKAVISAYLSFFPVLVSMVKGLRAPDHMQLDLLKTYGASEGQTFWKLRLPASLPYFFASLKVAVAAALIEGAPAVTIALAKRPGANATAVTHAALARVEAAKIVAAAKADIQKDLDKATAKADAEIGARAAESEKKISEIRAGAMEAVETVARDTAREIVAALGGQADAKAVTSAVTTRMKG